MTEHEINSNEAVQEPKIAPDDGNVTEVNNPQEESEGPADDVNNSDSENEGERPSETEEDKESPASDTDEEENSTEEPSKEEPSKEDDFNESDDEDDFHKELPTTQFESRINEALEFSKQMADYNRLLAYDVNTPHPRIPENLGKIIEQDNSDSKTIGAFQYVVRSETPRKVADNVLFIMQQMTSPQQLNFAKYFLANKDVKKLDKLAIELHKDDNLVNKFRQVVPSKMERFINELFNTEKQKRISDIRKNKPVSSNIKTTKQESKKQFQPSPKPIIAGQISNVTSKVNLPEFSREHY